MDSHGGFINEAVFDFDLFWMKMFKHFCQQEVMSDVWSPPSRFLQTRWTCEGEVADLYVEQRGE